MEEKKYTKTKLFLFLIFALFLIVFFVSTVNMVREMFSNIDKKNNELKCSNFNFEANFEKINNNYFLSINNKYSQDIKKLTIITNDKNFTIDTEPISQGNTKIIKVNISLLDAYIFPNECENQKIKIKNK